MIERTILKQIEIAINSRPVTLITGARQVEGTNYKLGVSLVICNANTIYPIKDNVYVVPLSVI